MLSKKCLFCDVIIYKSPKDTHKYWHKRKYCSSKCFGLSIKGKHFSPNTEFENDKHYSSKTEFKTGNIPWNKGKKGFLSKQHSPHWKGGKPSCKLCGKTLSAYKLNVCLNCLPITNQNQKSSNWMGERASYYAKHSWVTRRKGHPLKCQDCGKIGKKIKNKWNIDWANVNHKYSRNLDDYIPLCKLCHTKYDLKNNKN